MPFETISIGAQFCLIRDNSKWLTIQAVISLSVKPCFTNPWADSNTEIRCNTHEAYVKQPMEIRT